MLWPTMSQYSGERKCRSMSFFLSSTLKRLPAAVLVNRRWTVGKWVEEGLWCRICRCEVWRLKIVIILCLIVQDDQVDSYWFLWFCISLKIVGQFVSIASYQGGHGVNGLILDGVFIPLINYDELCYTYDLCRGCLDIDVPIALQWLRGSHQNNRRSTHRSIGSTRESQN